MSSRLWASVQSRERRPPGHIPPGRQCGIPSPRPAGPPQLSFGLALRLVSRDRLPGCCTPNFVLGVAPAGRDSASARGATPRHGTPACAPTPLKAIGLLPSSVPGGAHRLGVSTVWRQTARLRGTQLPCTFLRLCWSLIPAQPATDLPGLWGSLGLSKRFGSFFDCC